MERQWDTQWAVAVRLVGCLACWPQVSATAPTSVHPSSSHRILRAAKSSGSTFRSNTIVDGGRGQGRKQQRAIAKFEWKNTEIQAHGVTLQPMPKNMSLAEPSVMRYLTEVCSCIYLHCAARSCCQESKHSLWTFAFYASCKPAPVAQTCNHTNHRESAFRNLK